MTATTYTMSDLATWATGLLKALESPSLSADELSAHTPPFDVDDVRIAEPLRTRELAIESLRVSVERVAIAATKLDLDDQKAAAYIDLELPIAVARFRQLERVIS